MNYFRETVDESKANARRFENLFIGLDIGRQFNLSNSFGICLDFGAAYSIIDEETYLDSSNGELNVDDPTRIYPTANFQFFYRL